LSSLNAAHVKLKALTASFKHILFKSGYQISMLVPPPSSILGILMAAKGDYTLPDRIKFGYEFSYKSSGDDIERTVRFMLTKRGLVRQEQQGIIHRQTLFFPELDIYAEEEYIKYFHSPASAISLGRSQDLAWVEKVELVQLQGRKEGELKSTFVSEDVRARGLKFRLPSYILNDRTGYVRVNGPFKTYSMVLAQEGSVQASGKGLYFPDDSEDADHVIFIHDFSR